ncbi:hypothetical protein ACDX78_07100 [Virgibacillus oceani]
MLGVPEEALIHKKNQIVRLATLVKTGMIAQLTDFMDRKFEAKELVKIERIIDASYIKIQQYLLKMGQNDLTSSQSNEEVMLLHILNANFLSAFKDNDITVARENIKSQSYISQFENDIKFKHFNSLINKQEYNPNISAEYLDITIQLLQIYQHAMNVSRTVLGLI